MYIKYFVFKRSKSSENVNKEMGVVDEERH